MDNYCNCPKLEPFLKRGGLPCLYYFAHTSVCYIWKANHYLKAVGLWCSC